MKNVVIIVLLIVNSIYSLATQQQYNHNVSVIGVARHYSCGTVNGKLKDESGNFNGSIGKGISIDSTRLTPGKHIKASYSNGINIGNCGLNNRTRFCYLLCLKLTDTINTQNYFRTYDNGSTNRSVALWYYGAAGVKGLYINISNSVTPVSQSAFIPLSRLLQYTKFGQWMHLAVNVDLSKSGNNNDKARFFINGCLIPRDSVVNGAVAFPSVIPNELSTDSTVICSGNAAVFSADELIYYSDTMRQGYIANLAISALMNVGVSYSQSNFLAHYRDSSVYTNPRNIILRYREGYGAGIGSLARLAYQATPNPATPLLNGLSAIDSIPWCWVSSGIGGMQFVYAAPKDTSKQQWHLHDTTAVSTYGKLYQAIRYITINGDTSTIPEFKMLVNSSFENEATNNKDTIALSKNILKTAFDDVYNWILSDFNQKKFSPPVFYFLPGPRNQRSKGTQVVKEALYELQSDKKIMLNCIDAEINMADTLHYIQAGQNRRAKRILNAWKRYLDGNTSNRFPVVHKVSKSKAVITNVNQTILKRTAGNFGNVTADSSFLIANSTLLSNDTVFILIDTTTGFLTYGYESYPDLSTWISAVDTMYGKDTLPAIGLLIDTNTYSDTDSTIYEPVDTGFVDIPLLNPIQQRKVVLKPEVFYKFSGYYIIPAACTLEIKPGTWIFASPSMSQDFMSTLIVKKGGMIIADGKPDSAIVFTARGDSKIDPTALGPGAKNLWGGIIICGDAPVSNWNPGSYIFPEGIIHDNDPSFSYGGIDTIDNSGILRYVSIRHSGATNPMSGNINAISFCGVGKGTTVDYVEAFASLGDGFKWHGGNVNCKHLISAFNCDDHFDLDMGYKGGGQFWFSIESELEGGRGGEWDGWKTGNNFKSNPQIYNVTMIGSGRYSGNSDDNQDWGNGYMIAVADSLRGTFANMIVIDGAGKAVKAWQESVNAGFPAPFGIDGGLNFKSCCFWNFGGGTTWRDLFVTGTMPNPADSNYWFKPGREINNPVFKNGIVDPILNGISRKVNFAVLDPRPKTGSPVLNPTYATVPPADNFFTPTNYIGAFDAETLWADGWSKLSAAKILTPLCKITVADEELAYTNGDAYINVLVKIPNATVTWPNSQIELKINNSTITAGWKVSTLSQSRFLALRVMPFSVKGGVDQGILKPDNKIEVIVRLDNDLVLSDKTFWKVTF